MEGFSALFNFDNIGSKIKNFAKWSCWISIILFWISETIAFFALIADEWSAYLCWIPLVAAVVGPFLIWLSSWLLYAFGEMVENTCENANTSKEILRTLSKIEDSTKKTEKVPDNTTPSPLSKAVRIETPTPAPKKESTEEKEKGWAKVSFTEKGTIICSRCQTEQPSNRKQCFHCEAKFPENPHAPYWCAKCYHSGPYDGNCPVCGSTMKTYK